MKEAILIEEIKVVYTCEKCGKVSINKEDITECEEYHINNFKPKKRILYVTNFDEKMKFAFIKLQRPDDFPYTSFMSPEGLYISFEGEGYGVFIRDIIFYCGDVERVLLFLYYAKKRQSIYAYKLQGIIDYIESL